MLAAISFGIHAQNNYTASLGLITENDSYRWKENDRYYTNGIFIQLDYIPRTFQQKTTPDSRLKKVTTFYTLGQMMFTPGRRSAKTTWQIDRPYAGYLFLQKGFSFFYKRSVLQSNLNIGVTGRASLAKPLQNLMHDALNYKHFEGWQYQVKDEIGLNLQIKYDYTLLQPSRIIDVALTTQVTAGTIFTNTSGGFIVRLGLFEQASQSSFYNARIGNNQYKHKAEWYLYFRPQFVYQFYNATVQGRLLGNNDGSMPGELNHGIYEQQLGFMFAKNRWEAMINYTLKQKEVKSMKSNERYGAFGLAYKFGRLKQKP
ncbi:MAG: lipid A deacylase LpxR family protein [Chitinophagaceae bacterium]